MDWDREMCLQLIEFYRLKPEIWQPTHTSYHNKVKKQDAWNEIAACMGSSVDIVKSKINSLLSSFRRERTKENQSIMSGKGRNEIYRSKWFAYNSLRFLMDKNKSRHSLTAIKETNSDNEVETEVTADFILDEDTENNQQENTIEDISFVGMKEVNSVQETGENSPQENANDKSLFTTRQAGLQKIKKPKYDNKRLKEESIDRLLDTLQAQAQRDNCGVFGEHIAMKLRSYSTRTQSVVQHLINNILFNADMGQYDRQINLNSNYSNVVSDNTCFASRTSTPTEPLSPYCFDNLSAEPTYNEN